MTVVRLTIRRSKTMPPSVEQQEIRVADLAVGQQVAISVWAGDRFLAQIIVCDNDSTPLAYYVLGQCEPLFTPV